METRQLVHRPGVQLVRRLRVLSLVAALAAVFTSAALPVHAAVVIFDGFGDADLDNNGIPLEPADVDVSSAGDGAVEPYIALGNDGTPPVFPMDTMVDEVTAVENAGDVGIRWHSISGFTSAPGLDPRVSVHILDDSAASLPDTDPAIGYFHGTPGGPNAQRFATAIDDGLALAAEAKGRGNQFAGFFGDTIELGPEVNDAVKVSFDFRVWYSAPNLNIEAGINHIPAIGELRFGLYEDTDDQLGDSNPTAGRPDSVTGLPASAVWGLENGNFRGDAGDINAAGAQGDAGWFTRIHLDDPENGSFDKLPGGEESRINEEVNTGSAGDRRILNGASDFVARPDMDDPQFVNIDIDKVYNISMTLTRFDDPDTAGTMGDAIMATVTVVDRATSESWSFGGYEPVIDDDGVTPDGFSSDEWDYFVMGTAGASTSDDFDWLMDNFTLEVIGSNAPADEDADFDGDGDVDGADFLTWQRNLGGTALPPTAGDADGDGNVTAADLAIWRSQFGTTSGVVAAGTVPEPGAAALAGLALLGLIASRRERRR